MSMADQKATGTAKTAPTTGIGQKAIAPTQQPASPMAGAKVAAGTPVIQKTEAGERQQTGGTTKTELAPIWQFAETNQGVLSLAALVVALIFGLYEYRTNLRSSLVQRREYIKMLVGVIDEMLKFTSDLRARFDNGEPFQNCAAEWHDKIIAPRFLMNAMRANVPGDPLLAIEANRLWHSLQLNEHIDPSGSHNTRLAEMEANLMASKAAINARW